MAGCGGMLGDAFYNVFKRDNSLICSDKNPTNSWQSRLDFTNYDAYRRAVLEAAPDWLFHIGAETNLEVCENDEAYSFSTNSDAVSYAVEISNALNIPLLYISTAGIFSGDKKFFSEDDNPNPLGLYAKSKFLGESIVRSKSKSYLICRAGWMMGGGLKKDKKFIAKLCQQLLDKKRVLTIVDDKLGTPTFTKDFAETVFDLISKNHRGLYNLVCQGFTSRMDVARELVKLLGLDGQVTINGVPSDYFKEIYYAPRPENENLKNCALEKLDVKQMRDWRIALSDYIKSDWIELFKN